MSGSEGRWEPISWVREAGDPVPVCPRCGGLCKRHVGPGVPLGPTDDTTPEDWGHAVRDEDVPRVVTWHCDLHGLVDPDWIDPREDEDDDDR